MKNTELTNLLARVQAATGPDRELDAAICATLVYGGELTGMAEGWVPHVTANPPDRMWGKLGRVYVMARHVTEGDAPYPHNSWDAPPLTASLDAALALVERVLPGVWWLVRSGDEGEGDFANLGPAGTNPNEGGDCWSARANTPPLALLAALLKALALSRSLSLGASAGCWDPRPCT